MLTTVCTAATMILLLGVIMLIIRLIKGPTLMDKVLCLDGIVVCFVAIMVVLSVKWGTDYYLDLILIFSTFGFLSTVAFAYYLHKTFDNPTKQEHKNENDD